MFGYGEEKAALDHSCSPQERYKQDAFNIQVVLVLEAQVAIHNQRYCATTRKVWLIKHRALQDMLTQLQTLEKRMNVEKEEDEETTTDSEQDGRFGRKAASRKTTSARGSPRRILRVKSVAWWASWTVSHVVCEAAMRATGCSVMWEAARRCGC